MKRYLILLNLFFLTSCGYHTEDSNSRTISIPYVKGDQEGLLTDALVKAVSLSNQFTYAKGAELTLEAEIVYDRTEHIGWKYDRKPTSGERINRLVPSEDRREVTIRFSLISERSGKVIYGPTEVTADSAFDFVDSDSSLDTSFITPSGRRSSALFFSLGQLDSAEGAKHAALTPLYRKLAHKTIEGIENISFRN